MDKIIRKFFWVVLDLVFINISFILSLVLRFGKEWDAYFFLCSESLIYLSVSFFIFALFFRLYTRIWRYLSIGDLFLITEVVTAGVFVSYLGLNIVHSLPLPRTVITLTWFFSLAFIGGSRLVWRLYWEGRTPLKRREERILIVGAGDAGEIICREI